MSSGGTSFGTNTEAQRKRVMYFGTSVIYEGMPVCYDNSTTNVLGYDPYSSTASTTTTEGYQNEGKFLRVENPNADNVSMFAGVVAHGKNVGKTGVTTGVWVDIFIPNGAVVPVRTDSNCLIDQTILAITTGSQELGVPLATDSRPVAIARETIDRGTAGLVLAQLCPDRFIYQDSGGTALSVDDADTTTATVVNRININSLQTGGTLCGLHVNVTSAAGAHSSGEGLAGYFQANISAVTADTVNAVGIWTNITGGTQTQNIYGLEIGIWTATSLASAAEIVPLVVRDELSTGPTAASHFMMKFICDGSGDHPDGLFVTQAAADIAKTDAAGVTVAGKIAFKIGVPGAYTTWYIPCGTVTS